ncbi:MAG: hypothetical protein O4749_08415 [Trichodesmium sp. St5_bin2_1]|nr:hypothetical protein [Trichodesmium sp. St5_bin2_1]MDE5079871.1 hypothetical protein [Trichodesmium sp. St18_bin1]
MLQWDESFEKTQVNLVAVARKVEQQISKGKEQAMDYGKVMNLLLYHLYWDEYHGFPREIRSDY